MLCAFGATCPASCGPPVLQAGGRRVEAEHLLQSSDPEREGQRTRLLIAQVTVRARVGPPDTGKDGRAVEGTCLEGRIPKAEPGFEPQSFRQHSLPCWSNRRRRHPVTVE